ncbi:MAG TPA: hypothetical protein VJT15_26245 [Pyrinomonadaceae bacterium]|nr:hypothetical protein [Pyrinomonadaceae bacterium]
MKVLFLTVLLVLIPVVQEQKIVEREEPDLVVTKFNWTKFRQNSDLIHSALDPGPSMNEPISIKPTPPRNESQEVKNRRDMNERRAEMRATENIARNTQRDVDQYLLKLEVKNVGTGVIKSMVWEYQPATRAADYELRQYVCTLKAKPKESKRFELVSPFNPMKVVQADAETGEAKGGKVVINRIEYADGTIWKRKGWSVLIPSETINGLGNGKCLMF